MTLKERFPDRPWDDESGKKLKHLFRFGLAYGLIADNEAAMAYWRNLDQPNHLQRSFMNYGLTPPTPQVK